jgi:hypothetical protein
MIPGPDGWQLTPEGAAVHPVERVAVIADVHLGYEWARGAGGDCIPAHSLAETLAKLASLFSRLEVNRPGRVARRLSTDGVRSEVAQPMAGGSRGRADPGSWQS